MKWVFQRQYSCGPPLSRALTREKHERLFIVVAPLLQQLLKQILDYDRVDDEVLRKRDVGRSYNHCFAASLAPNGFSKRIENDPEGCTKRSAEPRFVRRALELQGMD